MSIFDLGDFTGWVRQSQDWALVAPPPIARELRSLGFSLMSRANNHALGWGVEGMRQTSRLLDEAGIVHAGASDSLARARAPRYVETGKGRVGLVAFHTTMMSDGSQASDQFGEIPARPGISSLRLRVSLEVTERAFDELREIESLLDPFGMSAVPAGGRALTQFEPSFTLGEKVVVRYELDAEDVAQIRAQVRAGKRLGDLLIVSAHVHEFGPAAGPPGFLTELAHELVDDGADVFVGHGVHQLWPVEVYRGVPILYGLGNFIADDTMGPIPENLYRDAGERLGRAGARDAEVIEALNEVNFNHERYFESAIARVQWIDGRPETTLHPVELGFGRGITRRGLPRLVAGDGARRSLSRSPSGLRHSEQTWSWTATLVSCERRDLPRLRAIGRTACSLVL
jgi:poly-gamma-glutamate synthesis protein (capsule biosynthesis protein)